MNNYEKDYLAILKDLLDNGKKSSNRTGIDTYKLWGKQLHIDLSEGFPLLTTKKLHWKSVVHELLWMISGDTNIQYLLKNGVTFWSEWPYRQYEIHHKNNHTPRFCQGFTSPMSQKEFEQTIINDDEFAKKCGSIGYFGYGGLWRRFPFYTDEDNFKPSIGVTGTGIEQWTFGEVDQLSKVIEELKTNPDSRRIIISAWHPFHSNRKEDALLPACHNYVQFGTEELTLSERLTLLETKNKELNLFIPDSCWQDAKSCDTYNIPKYRLNCYFNMRSSDTFLGLPFNCAFYALFTYLIANQLNMVPGQLVYSAADVHLYSNHVEQAKIQLQRMPKELPTIKIKTSDKSIFDIRYEDIELIGYNPDPAIKADVAV